MRMRLCLCLALLPRLAYPRAAAGAISLSPRWPTLTRSLFSQTPVGAPPYPCSALPLSPGGEGPSLPGSSGRFTGASELASIFSLSTPQLKKFKPQHMLWPRGLGKVFEAVPWVDCFPIISVALPS